MADLQATQGEYDQAVVKAADRRGREEQVLAAEYSIVRATNPSFFDAMERTGKAAFAIPLGHPEFNRGGTAFVTVYEVGFNADGIATKTGEFTLRLTHQGNSTFLDPDGNLMNFSHRKRPTTLAYRKKNEQCEPIVDISNNLEGNERYLYLSPFAGWTLQTTGDDHVDWSGVKEVKFSFKVRFVPSASAASIGPRFIQTLIK